MWSWGPKNQKKRQSLKSLVLRLLHKPLEDLGGGLIFSWLTWIFLCDVPQDRGMGKWPMEHGQTTLVIYAPPYCSGHPSPPFERPSWAKSPPHAWKGKSPTLLPLSLRPLVGWSYVAFASVIRKKTQRNPCLPADPYLIGLESDQLCHGLSPPHSRKGPESLQKQTIRCFLYYVRSYLCALLPHLFYPPEKDSPLLNPKLCFVLEGSRKDVHIWCWIESLPYCRFL